MRHFSYATGGAPKFKTSEDVCQAGQAQLSASFNGNGHEEKNNWKKRPARNNANWKNKPCPPPEKTEQRNFCREMRPICPRQRMYRYPPQPTSRSRLSNR